MTVLRHLISLLLMLAASLPTVAVDTARQGDPPFDVLLRNWNSRDGLPHDRVRAIARTHDGFLWIGTDGGLARFDGANFMLYGLQEGLGAITVFSLLEGRDGTLWVGTQGGGVSAVRKGRIERTYSLEDGLPSASILGLAEDDDGRLWVSTISGFRYLDHDRFVVVPGSPSGGAITLSGMFRDREGTLWITIDGREPYQWKSGAWSQPKNQGPRRASMVCEDSKGRLWMMDNRHQLWCREASDWKVMGLPAQLDFHSIAAADDGTIWLISFRNGIYGLRDDRLFLIPRDSGNAQDFIEFVTVTSDGRTWLGSCNGLYALTPRKLSLALIDDKAAGQGANFIGALVESSPGEFVVGTQGRGFYRWSRNLTARLSIDPKLSALSTGNAAITARDGSVWIGGNSGLYRFQNYWMTSNHSASSGASEVWVICEDLDGSIWAGLGDGRLFHLVEGNMIRVPYGGGREQIKGLLQEKNGTLWVGTRGGGLFRRKDGSWKHFGRAEGLISEVIRMIHADSSGHLWIGTAGGGLSVLNGERFISITSHNGLPDDTVSQIAEDREHRLWIGTNRGLAVLNEDEVDGILAGKADDLHPLTITRPDGLLSEEFTIVPPVRMADGRMAFATTRGIAMLRPEDFQQDESTPPVFIERVLVDGQPIEVHDGKVILPPGSLRLELEVTGLNFSAPERLIFRNRLSGLETDWGKPSSQRVVEYRNLAPNDYRFEVSASNGNGLWSTTPAILDITLQPHYWQTAWFRVLAVIGVLSLVALIVRRREQMKSRIKIERLKREQAVQEERARIARDLHDDVGSSLTHVALLSELAQGDLEHDPERAGEHINEIFTTAKKVTRSLDEIVWAVNPTHDTLEGFALFLSSFVQTYARTAGLKSRLDIPETLPDVVLDAPSRHHFYLATKEVLHNIVKHASATEIRLKLSLEPDCLRLIIEDDGIGFSPDAATAGGDGLGNLRQRLQQIGGTYTCRSAPGQGTTVEMVMSQRFTAEQIGRIAD